MPELTVAEIELAGEEHVEIWLSANGYTNIYKEILLSKETEIKATGSKESILVQVRSFLHPRRPFKLSDLTVDKMIRRASNSNHIAYVAYVVIDIDKKIVGEINWERLS